MRMIQIYLAKQRGRNIVESGLVQGLKVNCRFCCRELLQPVLYLYHVELALTNILAAAVTL